MPNTSDTALADQVAQLMQEVRRLTDERDVRALVDSLFTLTDAKDWNAATALFVEEPIAVDMSSLAGGGPVTMPAAALFDGFRQNLFAEKHSHHMAGNHVVTLRGDEAEVTSNGYAWNLLPTRGGDPLWETWGSYDFTARRTSAGWRLASIRYSAKHNRGNEAVRLASTANQ
jgi:hypothetical protein